MKLKYKNTIYNPIYELSKDNKGLKEEDVWVNIKFQLKNDEIDYKGIFPGITFDELKKWNEVNKKFLEGNMKGTEEVTFIRRIGELKYYPNKNIVEKKLYLFDNVNKYYTIYIDREELYLIYEDIKRFIETATK